MLLQQVMVRSVYGRLSLSTSGRSYGTVCMSVLGSLMWCFFVVMVVMGASAESKNEMRLWTNGDSVLLSQWRMISSANLSDGGDGRTISTPGYNASAWYPIEVRGKESLDLNDFE